MQTGERRERDGREEVRKGRVCGGGGEGIERMGGRR